MDNPRPPQPQPGPEEDVASAQPIVAKSRRKWVLPAAIAAVVLLAALGCAYFFTDVFKSNDQGSNYTVPSPAAAPAPSPDPTPSVVEEEETADVLDIKELGLKVPLDNSPYGGITYEMRSKNEGDPEYMALVYSKDLLERYLQDCGIRCEDLSHDEKLSFNRSIAIYYFDPSGPHADSPISILGPDNITSSSQIYVGNLGPAEQSSNPKIVEAYSKFLEYMKTQVKKVTDRKVVS